MSVTRLENGEQVTCRACDLSYEANTLFPFFRDTEGEAGLCLRCHNHEEKHGEGTAPPVGNPGLEVLDALPAIF